MRDVGHKNNPMSNFRPEFLTALPQGPPRTLVEAISRLRKQSRDFTSFWNECQIEEASKVSEDAFSMLDHIQNEILRHRDIQAKSPDWSASELKQCLERHVGIIVSSLSVADKERFFSLAQGEGRLPIDCETVPLTLAKALNKLKHRNILINFRLESGKHILCVFTVGGMGNSDSLCEFDVEGLCIACEATAERI